ncbi:hypothetical protein [Azospirillum canadense]|uniref:hypothetical protein n=1 Tax=Azospirillum canadense TaxID=403962 RepID=UPI00222716D4|nr:hypothetical protein [Azospirillum canadense]MCW2240370.1 hypothetical protein [Azospirillum canadense]
MFSRRSWGAERRGTRGLGAAMAVGMAVASGTPTVAIAQGFGSGGGSGAGRGDFLQRCVERNKSLPQTLGFGVDVSVICACQAKKLRERKYDPETIDATIRQAYLGAVQNGRPPRAPGEPANGEESIDPQTRDKLRGGVNRIMQDLSAAFQECIRGDVERNAVQSMKKSMGLGS